MTFPPPVAPRLPGRPPMLSERIELLRASIEPLQKRVMSEATTIDATGRWSASMVAAQALDRARLNLAVAALSLGVQEDLGA